METRVAEADGDGVAGAILEPDADAVGAINRGAVGRPDIGRHDGN